MYHASTYLALIPLIQSFFAPYLIYAEIVLKFASLMVLMFCRPSGGFASHLVIN